jgi:hypothetical protein
MMVADGCSPGLFPSPLLAIRFCYSLLIFFSLWRVIMHPSYPFFFGAPSLIGIDTSLCPGQQSGSAEMRDAASGERMNRKRNIQREFRPDLEPGLRKVAKCCSIPSSSKSLDLLNGVMFAPCDVIR